MHRALERGLAGTCQRTALTCANLLRLQPALWTFLSDAAVPPTNNTAEQALRTIVLKRKILGLTHSRRGEEFIARGYTVVESCKRQGRDALAYVRQADARVLRRHHDALAGALGLSALPARQPGSVRSP